MEAGDTVAAPGCACTRVRRAGRALTRLYDEVLAPSGLRVTQYAVLATLTRLGPSAVGRLAEELAMDRTTLTRALAPLQREGLVRVDEGADRRTRLVRATATGEAAVARARPLWLEAQARVASSLGRERFESLLGELAAVEALVRSRGRAAVGGLPGAAEG